MSASGKMVGIEKYYAPKGQKIIAQGFNPGLLVAKRCALKVAPDVSATREINTPWVEHNSRPPLSGRSDFLPNPGLKPWAMIFCHLRGNRKTPFRYSITPTSITPLLHYSIAPILHHSTTPLLHHSITPSLHYSITPLLHYSITPLLHHSVPPRARFEHEDEHEHEDDTP
jgi:hypothetical protein